MKTTTPLFERSRKQLLIYSITSLFSIFFLASCDKNPLNDGDDTTQKLPTTTWSPTTTTQWTLSYTDENIFTKKNGGFYISLKDTDSTPIGSQRSSNAIIKTTEFINIKDTIIINYDFDATNTSGKAKNCQLLFSTDSGKVFNPIAPPLIPPYTFSDTLYSKNPILIGFSIIINDSVATATISNLTIRKK